MTGCDFDRISGFQDCNGVGAMYEATCQGFAKAIFDWFVANPDEFEKTKLESPIIYKLAEPYAPSHAQAAGAFQRAVHVYRRYLNEQHSEDISKILRRKYGGVTPTAKFRYLKQFYPKAVLKFDHTCFTEYPCWRVDEASDLRRAGYPSGSTPDKAIEEAFAWLLEELKALNEKYPTPDCVVEEFNQRVEARWKQFKESTAFSDYRPLKEKPPSL